MYARSNEYVVIFCPVRKFDPIKDNEDLEIVKPFIKAEVVYSDTDRVKKMIEKKEDVEKR